MPDVAVQAEGLSKRYRLGLNSAPYKRLTELLWGRISQPLRSTKRELAPKADDFIWALRDVDLTVGSGELVGVIGRNGAGKTTLLRILSRITEPTEGWARINGRVGALLEVGTGFHPELTGRENVYLNGAILGMRKAEIERKFDEIVAFAELARFIDTPVKRYSSGMQVRLAFAVAAFVEPEILLVDEVLAVGDAAFQRRCLGKMGDVSRAGRTVLFVSHNMQAVRSFCERCIVMEAGRIAFAGDVDTAIDRYLSQVVPVGENIETASTPRPSEIADESLRITKVRIEPSGGRGVLESRSPLKVTMHFRTTRELSDVVFGFVVRSGGQTALLDCRSSETLGPLAFNSPGAGCVRCTIPYNVLGAGVYSLSVGARSASKGLDYIPDVLTFEVHDSERYESLWLEAPNAMVRVPSEWDIEMADR